MLGFLKKIFTGKNNTKEVQAIPYKEAFEIAESGKNLKVIFLNPLTLLLSGAEKKKGSPLTKQEVFQVRNNAKCLVLPKEQAEVFLATLGSFSGLHQINPRRCWTEWQQIRDQIEFE